jgi:hypothetical protein
MLVFGDGGSNLSSLLLGSSSVIVLPEVRTGDHDVELALPEPNITPYDDQIGIRHQIHDMLVACLTCFSPRVANTAGG